MKIAAYQGEGVSGDIAKALDLLQANAAEAARAGAGLVVFPELFLTGYNIGAAVFELAEPAGGPSAAKVSAIARETGLPTTARRIFTVTEKPSCSRVGIP
jgi:predicted amidohydrolase